LRRKPKQILLKGNTFDYDGHRAVKDSAQFTTLSEVHALTIYNDRSLVEATGEGIKFKTEGRNSKRVNNVTGSYDKAYVGIYRKDNPIVNFK
jgi:hypothetical protein